MGCFDTEDTGKKFLAYLPPKEEGGGEVTYHGGGTLLYRLFENKIQILGWDRGGRGIGHERRKHFNKIVMEVDEDMKEGEIDAVRGQTGYKGTITFLQDDTRTLIEV
jgi:hypothetical protein